jgi:hypothetical protein
MTLMNFKTFQTILALLFAGSVSMFAEGGNAPFPEVPYGKWQSGNMTITCQVVLDGQVLTSGDVVAAYYDDEIRGKFTIDEDNMAYLTVGGNAQTVPLHFKVYTGGRIIEVDQGTQFSWNGELGSYADPYIINLPTPVTTNTSSEGWATTCLPYNAEVPKGVTVFTANRIEDNVLKIEPVTCNILPANTPVLLKTEGQTSYEWLSRVADGDATIEANLFKGTTAETAVEAKSVLTLGHANEGEGKIGFWLFDGTTIPANRAYLEKSSTAGVRGITIDWSGTPTGVQTVKAGNDNPADSPCYDLTGRPFSGRGGLKIINGKKIVVK